MQHKLKTLLAHIHRMSEIDGWVGVCGCGTIQQPTCVTHAAHGTLVVTMMMGSIVKIRYTYLDSHPPKRIGTCLCFVAYMME